MAAGHDLMMRNRSARWRSVLTGLIGLSCLLPGAGSAQANPLHGAILGRAVDEVTGTGIPGAEVEFLDTYRRVLARTTADNAGFFSLSRLPPGPFRLRVRRLGYVETTTPVWWVQVGEMLDLMVWLRPDAIPLAPLEVVGLTRLHVPVLEGFYRRKEASVGGFFLDRKEIEERNASRVTDLLADLPGVRLENVPGYPGQARAVTFSRSPLGPGGGRCPVQVFMDGTLATRRSGGVPLDELVSPNALEGIEIYRGLSSVPAEFVTPEARCGVIALWTKRDGGFP